MFHTLGLASDALVMNGHSTFEDRGTHIVQRTPAEPRYWFGNQVIFRALPDAAGDALDAFATAFPAAPHCVISVDLPQPEVPGWLADLPDFAAEHTDVLVLDGVIRGPALPAGLVPRQIVDDGDWAQVVTLQHAVSLSQGYTPGPAHSTYIEAKFARIRAACARGGFAWFGVFDGPVLAADMGITWNGQIARYQSVETHQDYRRQGICAALLVHVLGHARAQSPRAVPVILAEKDGAPGRIYRRAGFRHRETLLSLVKEGY